MAQGLEDIQNSLRGDVRDAGARDTAVTGLDRLSQLSDVALGSGGAVPARTSQQTAAFSQELIMAPNPMALGQASQPDIIIPPPNLPTSQDAPAGEQDGKDGAAATAAAAMPGYMMQPVPGEVLIPGLDAATYQLMMQQGTVLGAGSDEMGGEGQQLLAQPAPQQQQQGGRGKSGKPTRRGPMDEMRQLVRILVKILPHSIGHIDQADEAGGGNRISEDQIKSYLAKTLGDAPQPSWGVPEGWSAYVANLFTWATGKEITDDQAKRCAKREPGRSWEALESELQALGVYPKAWPLPLTQEGVRAAQNNPQEQPVPQVPSVKREGGEGSNSKRGGGRGGGGGGGGIDLERMSRLELWRHLAEVTQQCINKFTAGGAMTDAEQAELLAAHGTASNNMMQMQIFFTNAGLPVPMTLPLLSSDATTQMQLAALMQSGIPALSLAGMPGVLPFAALNAADGEAAAAAAAVVAAAAGYPAAQLPQPSAATESAPADVEAAAAAAAAASAQPAAAQAAAAGGESGERTSKRRRAAAGVAEPVKQEGVKEEEAGDEGPAKRAKAPLSSKEARGTLIGALDPEASVQRSSRQGAAAGAAAGRPALVAGAPTLELLNSLATNMTPVQYPTNPETAAALLAAGSMGAVLPKVAAARAGESEGEAKWTPSMAAALK